MNFRHLLGTVMILGTVMGLTPPVMAQGERPTDNRDYGVRYDPDRWVRVGIDYNNDGHFDRFEYLNVRDLERARERSTERRENGQMTQRGQRMGYYGEQLSPEERERRFQVEQERAREMKTLSGTLTNLEAVSLAGVDPSERDHLIARIRTVEGRVARVDLGPVANVEQLNLKEGDPVTVHGRLGTINDAGMLMARRVEAPAGAVSVLPVHDRDMRRYRGEVVAIRPASFRAENAPDVVIARVRLDSGAVTALNLGPVDQLRDLDWNNLRGREIGFLAHPARMGDRVALVADQLRVDGRTIPIDWASASVRAPAGGPASTQPAPAGPTG